MPRNILLIEPNYQNKYPPMGLMKLATYHKRCGDNVVFYKGKFSDFIAKEICKELIFKLYQIDDHYFWEQHIPTFIEHILKGSNHKIENILCLSRRPQLVEMAFTWARSYYTKKEYFKKPKWDRVCICTLFTFHWKITVETILWAKKLSKSPEDIIVGGIAASLVPEEIKKATGITPIEGLLDKPEILDKGNFDIIDTLPLDYSILNEIEYSYPASNAYFGYTTRGCINRCNFCAVPTLEPDYKHFIPLKRNINYIAKNFGEQKDLLLLDNNVLASKSFTKIIETIKELGFTKEAQWSPPNLLEITIQQLKQSFNDEAFLALFHKLMQDFLKRLRGQEKQDIYDLLEENFLLKRETITKKHVLSVYPQISSLYEQRRNKAKSNRYVDFNQGLDAALFTEKKTRLLSQIPIRPLRIAFDNWSERNIYSKAIRLVAKHGITDLSNYILYNSNNDTPEQLYWRLELNILLCDELDVSINSFPMKYHPITEPEYFTNRDFIGKHWTKKFVRAIQAILNATKGSVGRGNTFFYKAFGNNVDEYKELLYMPEPMIIYRLYMEKCHVTEQWSSAFHSLSEGDKDICLDIIHNNDFQHLNPADFNRSARNLLRFYLIKRDDIDKAIKANQTEFNIPHF